MLITYRLFPTVARKACTTLCASTMRGSSRGPFPHRDMACFLEFLFALYDCQLENHRRETGIMAYTSLLSSIYAHFATLLASWDDEAKKTHDIGVFAFMPEGYRFASELRDTRFTYWPATVLSSYLKEGGQSEDGLADLFQDHKSGEDFFVMIVEDLGDGIRHAVHVHKITNLGLN